MARRRKPGRPVAGRRRRDAREALMQAASALFAERGAEAVSVREVATRAGVSPAMINYYFGDKKGLMHAVLERGLDRILEVVTEVASRHDGPVASNFIDGYIRAVQADPSLPQLMVREVLSGTADYQEAIREKFARKALELMPPRVAEDIEGGYLRRDLDPRLLMISLVGMCIFPYIARPLIAPVMGLAYDDTFAETLIAHTTSLFTEGAVPR